MSGLPDHDGSQRANLYPKDASAYCAAGFDPKAHVLVPEATIYLSDALPPLRVSDLRELVERARAWDAEVSKHDRFVNAEDAADMASLALSALLARMGLGAQT